LVIPPSRAARFFFEKRFVTNRDKNVRRWQRLASIRAGVSYDRKRT